MRVFILLALVCVAGGAVWVYEMSRPAPLPLGSVREAEEKADANAIGKEYESHQVLLLPADLDEGSVIAVMGIADLIKKDFDGNADTLAAAIKQHKALYVSKGDRLRVVAVRGELSQVINLSTPKQSTAAWMPTSTLIASPSSAQSKH